MATIDRELTTLELVGYDGAADTRLVKPAEVGIDPAINRYRDEARIVSMVEAGYDHARACASGYAISEREDGTLVWIDGQHRGETAVRCGYGNVEVPALVFTGLTPVEEGDLVLKLNADRKGVSPAERHRIGVNAGWEIPTRTQAICDLFDVVIDGKTRPRHIGAVNTAHLIVSADDGEAMFAKVLETLVPSIDTASDPNVVLSSVMLKGVEAFWRAYPDADLAQLVKRLQKFNVQRVYVLARSRATRSSKSARTIREILVEIYDNGRAKNRLRPMEID